MAYSFTGSENSVIMTLAVMLATTLVAILLEVGEAWAEAGVVFIPVEVVLCIATYADN